jgi:DNA adenine methylase
MKYLGGKSKTSKFIINEIEKYRFHDDYFVDVFGGGMNVIDKVSGKRIANDNNYCLIEMWKAVQKGWEPPEIICEYMYNDIKNNKKIYPPYLVSFVGFASSFGGKWFGGYARGKNSKNKERNYALESRNSILKQRENLKDVKFICKNFWELKIPKNSIIYCDPPYQGTTKYKDEFDHEFFWKWVRNIHNQGGKIFVSEYNAPDDFKCIWEKETNSSIANQSKDSERKRIEKLFVHENFNF